MVTTSLLEYVTMIPNNLACEVHNATELIASNGARVIRWTLTSKASTSLVFPEDQMNQTHPVVVVADTPFTKETAAAYIAACQRWSQPYQASAERARAARRRLRQTARARTEQSVCI